MYEADVDMNVGYDGFQIRNAGIHWFQSRKLRSVLCADADYLMKRKTNFGYFYGLRIIRRADYRAEITVLLCRWILDTGYYLQNFGQWKYLYFSSSDPQCMVQMQFVPFWDPHNFLLEYPMGLKVSYLESRARNSLD